MVSHLLLLSSMNHRSTPGKSNKHKHIIAGSTIGLTILSVFVIASIITPNLEAITDFSIKYPFLAPIAIILWRILAVVIPPLPGGLVSLALIPVFGWFASFLYATTGLMIGAAISFLLARRFREPLVKKFVPLQQLHSWEGKLSNKNEFWVFLGIRMSTEAIMDFISYIAGLSKISFTKFIVATFISLIPNALIFYLGETVYKEFYQKNAFLAVLVILILGLIYYKIFSRKAD